MSNRVELALGDRDPVTRIVGLAACWDPGQEEWVRTYFGNERGDPVAMMDAVRQRLGGVRVSIVTGDEPALANMIVTRRARLSAKDLDDWPRLRSIQKLGKWPTGIDVPAAESRGIRLTCHPRPSITRTAEHAVLLMLASGKKLRVANDIMSAARPSFVGDDGSAYNWAGMDGLRSLHSETVALLGLGEVGREVASILQGFSCRVVYWQRHRASTAEERTLGVTWVDLDEALRSTFVSLHLPLTDSTIGWMDSEKFRGMAPGSIFINTSRGRIVDEQALLDAIESGRVSAAGLDVHATEPAPWDALRRHPSVVVTPHTGGGSRLSIIDESRTVMDAIAAFARGTEPSS
jgi:phosphoglycerate dehydrogenase-like enzyme